MLSDSPDSLRLIEGAIDEDLQQRLIEFTEDALEQGRQVRGHAFFFCKQRLMESGYVVCAWSVKQPRLLCGRGGAYGREGACLCRTNCRLCRLFPLFTSMQVPISAGRERGHAVAGVAVSRLKVTALSLNTPVKLIVRRVEDEMRFEEYLRIPISSGF